MRTEPVLLVHGFASSFELNWREPGWVDLLTEGGREVIGLDLPGHGTATKPHDPAEYDLEAAVLAAVPVGPRPDVVAFSLGARVTLTVAGENPHLFGRIVVAGVGDDILGQRPNSDALATAVEKGAAVENVTAGLFARFARANGNDPVALAACLRAPRPVLTDDTLGAITSSVLVVIGEDDFAGPADALAAAIPDAQLLVIPRCDHFATPTRFEFIDAALTFLDAVPQF